MIIRCTKCSTEFDLDPSQVGPEGVTLRCSVCSHMFHAEPEPDPDVGGGPWRMSTVEKHLFELPTLREIVEQVADGRLRPDDQISHSGGHWIKLGEIPEFSPLFIGKEGLTRMFRAIEAPSALELGPPPTFGTGVDEPAPIRREETHRFDLGGELPEPALPLLDDDGPVPAPPQFDTPSPPPRTTRAQRRTGNVSSMLDAVTKAVSSDSLPRVEDEPDSPHNVDPRERSQPILVSDLARRAAQSVAAAVQRVEGQRASERAARDKSRSGSESSRPGPELSARLGERSSELDASERRPVRDGSSGLHRPEERSATSAAVSAAVAGAAISVPPTSSLSTLGSEPSNPATASLTAPEGPRAPDVVIVKVENPQNKGAAGVYALAGVLVALGIVFGIPGIRERLLNLGGEPPVAAKTEVKPPAAEPSEFIAARNAMRTLGLTKTKQAITDLERVVDDPERDPGVVAAARLTQAEVMLLRVLSAQIAIMLEPENRDLPQAVDADLADAGALVEAAGPSADATQLARVQVLLALAQGKLDAPALADVNAPEQRVLILGAPLWRDPKAPIPNGLITSLQGVPNPSALHQSLLALALWRSGDDEGARKVLDSVLGRVGDMQAAVALRAALDRSAAEKGETLPPPPEPPPEPATPGASDPNNPEAPPEDPIRPDGEPGTRPVRPATPTSPENEATSTLISTGCQKVRGGDPDGGIKLLLAAHDKLGGSRNLDLCLCLGTGFLAKNTHDSALSWFKRAVSQAPANREAIAGAARSAELAGKHGVAVEYYRKLVEIEPGNQTARNYLQRHDSAGKSAPPPEDPGDLLPVGKKSP
ncbi:zinc-ribbon domain-containing protein [Nannocystis pusilla]|uniref:Zinc-ribbon domain-containing protein n=1 Tax=Nannocystis pusilla TaxID=889268 RepID=A0ABS7TW12_9BACT|nr:zinc-ribbon domain-containing protein [Nannocystis pusilla]MBZ5712455.1 zinc-ribbon domain-containing protein [Nannocystis pusilla]